ncbi:MAG: glycosyltransferase family 2 protein [Chitinophagales bacterium]|nr:glycosyltransferase family 2 protein [Chitinophagales bacterium]
MHFTISIKLKSAHNQEVAVIILNYNGRHWLEKFLPSVTQNTSSKLASIWVVDNASTDGSVKMIKEQFKSVYTISLSKNYGFAEGYNRAIENIECKYAVLLNSDVEVTENWLPPLYNALKKDKMLAACQPKMLDYKQPKKFEYAGAAGGMIDKYGYPFCRGRIFQEIEEDAGQYDDEIEIFWASGACLCIKRNLFLLADGFDKDFFAHMEEIDLCWRLKRLGYKIKYLPESVIYHVGGGTLNVQNPNKTFLNFRNNRLLLIKNIPMGKVLMVGIVRNFLDFIALMVTVLKFRFNEAFAILKAQFAYRKMMSKALDKRSEFDTILEKYQIDNPNLKGIYPKSLLFSFYINRRKKFNQLKW